jgi:phosphate-selective porin OprO/OprP
VAICRLPRLNDVLLPRNEYKKQVFRANIKSKKEEKVSKKFLAVGAILAAAVLVGQGAQAKTLEDILKEKGVITEADYKEVTKSKPLDYKLGKGFTFTSADEKFQLSLGGRMQFRYTFMDNASGNDTSQFMAQRIRLIAQGYAYSKDFTYKMEIDPRVLATGGNGSKGGLLDCFINYKVMDELQFLVGQTKVKHVYSMIQADSALMFVDRAPVIGYFAPGYEIGAFAYGNVAGGIVNYAISGTNGDGQTNAANTNHNAFAARVGFSPLGKMSMDEPDLAISKKPLFTVGANYYYNNLNDGENWSSGYGGRWNNHSDIHNYGVDAHFKWMGLALQGEALFAQGDSKATSQSDRAMGWYTQLGYNITPKIGLAVRYSQYDKDRAKSGDLQSEQIGAVSYYFDKHNLKVTADVGNIHNQANNGPDKDSMQYRVQAQIIF